MNPANALVTDIADQQTAVTVEHEAVRLAKLRVRTGPAVAAESRRAGARDRADDARCPVDLPDHVVVALRDVQVAEPIEPELVRHVQGRGRCRPAVAAVPTFAVAGDCCQPLRRKIEAPDALVVEIAEVQGAVGSDHQAVRIVHLRFGIAGHAGADERGHGRRRGATSVRGEEKRNEENSRGHGCGGIILYYIFTVNRHE